MRATVMRKTSEEEEADQVEGEIIYGGRRREHSTIWPN